MYTVVKDSTIDTIFSRINVYTTRWIAMKWISTKIHRTNPTVSTILMWLSWSECNANGFSHMRSSVFFFDELRIFFFAIFWLKHQHKINSNLSIYFGYKTVMLNKFASHSTSNFSVETKKFKIFLRLKQKILTINLLDESNLYDRVKFHNCTLQYAKYII